MTELDQAIQKAYTSEGKQEDVNKVYLALLRNPVFIPVKKDYVATEDEPFQPLSTMVEEKHYLIAFDTLDRLTQWAGEQFSDMNYVEISGKDFVAGINEEVFFALNAGEEFYKEFSPDEIKHLKKIIARIDQLKEP